MPETEMAHNDLNARNILVVAAGGHPAPVVIDWARLGSAIAYTDYARIEADATVEVVERVLSDEYAPGPREVGIALRMFEEHLYGLGRAQVIDIPASWGPFVDAARAIVKAVRSTLPKRRSGRDVATYTLVLGLTYLSYLRRPYWDRLSTRTRAFACYLAMRCFERAVT